MSEEKIPRSGKDPVSMKIDVEITLVDIKMNNAYFDLKPVVTLDENIDEIKISSRGSGNMVYNINENYFSESSFNLSLDMVFMLNDGISVNVKSTQKSIDKTISK